MQHTQRSVTRYITRWGSVYRIGGADADGEILPPEQADDLIARFNFEQSLFSGSALLTLEIGSEPTMPNLSVLTHAVSR